MRQGIVTLILGIVGTLLAQMLNTIHDGAQENTLTYWLTDFSNGDVLAMVEILLICYIYARIREIKKALPQVSDSARIPRIFGF